MKHRLDEVGAVAEPADPRGADDFPLDVADPVGGDVGVDIHVHVEEQLFYAMAHNGVKVLRKLTLVNQSGSALENLHVRVELLDRGQPISPPWERVLERLLPGPLTFDAIDMVLDPAVMSQVEERRPAELVVTVTSGVSRQRDATPVMLLAGNQWVLPGGSPGLGMQLLTAFVQPNHPAVRRLLRDASNLLGELTGDTSLQGYQSGPGRTDEIACAIYEALRALKPTYSNPPASWDVVVRGQKVRSPGDVLDERVGTCLDTTLTMAAALEQAGLNPLLWVVRRHAFVGYWRDEKAALSETVLLPRFGQDTDALNELANLVDSGRMRLVETTTVTTGTSAAFDDAVEGSHSPARRFVRERPNHIEGVVDVWRARAIDRIMPLPARQERPDGTVEIIEYRPPETDLSRRNKGDAAAEPTSAARVTLADPSPARVQKWKNSLLDLTLRNRLLNFKSGGTGSVELLVPEHGLSVVEDMLHEKRPLTLLPADKIDDLQKQRGASSALGLPHDFLSAKLADGALWVALDERAYATRLRGLAAKGRTIIEETGANNLYLALGTLVWSPEATRGGADAAAPLRSPLVLVPVKLAGGTRGRLFTLELDESGTSTPNYCLLEKLRQDLALSIPGLLEPETDEAGIDLDAAFGAVRAAVQKERLPFRVDETADLAILQFAKFRLWKDLEEHWHSFMENPLIRHLVEDPAKPFHDPAVPAGVDPAADVEQEQELDVLATACPVPADSSQLRAVTRAVGGRTFVLEGPPGTGKSQTITNVLVRAVAEGKRVLSVAEKRAALDVVKSRLDAVGLTPFALDLHDEGNKPAEVRQHLLASMGYRGQADEEALRESDSDLRSAVTTLSRYAARLHQRNTVGLSLYEAHERLLALGDGDVAPVPTDFVVSADVSTVNAIRRLLDDLPALAEDARLAPNHPWRWAGELPFEQLDRPAVAAALATIAEIRPLLTADDKLGPLVRAARCPDDLALLAEVARARVPLSVFDQARDRGWRLAAENAARSVEAFAAAPHEALRQMTPQALDLPLDELLERAQAAAAAGIFARKRRLGEVLDDLRPALLPDAAPEGKRLPEIIASMLALRDQKARIERELAAIPGLVPAAGWSPFIPGHRSALAAHIRWLQRVSPLLAPDETNAFVTETRSAIGSGLVADEEFLRALETAAAQWASLLHLLHSRQADVGRWADTGLIDAWDASAGAWGRDARESRFLGLQRWSELVLALAPLRIHGLTTLRDQLLDGAIEPHGARRAFDRGLAAAALVERTERTGLNSFDGHAHDRVGQQMNVAAASVRELLVDAIPLDLLRARSFSTGTTLGEVGLLQRELSKGRRPLAVRELMRRYGGIITELTPCVLVSPDSIARFLPPGAVTFDLVVFDEASQIRVAESIGAMGRAKSVVVVGDSRQMPPSTIGDSVGSDDLEPASESESFAVEDEESILSEAVQAGVPRLWLSWHYRSQDEALIAFSNHQYYEGRLSSFPAPASSDGRRGVSLIRVAGHFNRGDGDGPLRTNVIEARAVVAEVVRLVNHPAESKGGVGVVTFNIQQRDLILAMLQETGDPRIIECLEQVGTDTLFVKNLENVQGDERDVILFSIGFSARAPGKPVPLNFGPLNRAGGERRLNVAVTRARRQVKVFCSFDPEDLKAENTTSTGLRHLRAYLDMASRGVQTSGDAVANQRASVDRHREEVAVRLRARGLTVRTSVGLSDFRIDLTVAVPEAPDAPVMAVLLDGPEWARRATVGDRDSLPTDVLAKLMGWPTVARVWLPTWRHDWISVVDELEQQAYAAAKDQAEAMLAGQDASAPTMPADTNDSAESLGATFLSMSDVLDVPQTGGAAPVAQSEERDNGGGLTAVLPGEAMFVPWYPRLAGDRSCLDDPSNPRSAAAIRAVISEIAAAEAPMHCDRLARLVGGAFGLGRVRQDRVTAILSLLPSELQREPRSGFIWPADVDIHAWRGFRRSTQQDGRPLEHIALQEICNAMVALVDVARALQRRELLRETLAVFGSRRLTEGLRLRLETALHQALQNGRLAEDGELIRLADRAGEAI